MKVSDGLCVATDKPLELFVFLVPHPKDSCLCPIHEQAESGMCVGVRNDLEVDSHTFFPFNFSFNSFSRFTSRSRSLRSASRRLLSFSREPNSLPTSSGS